MIQHFLDWALDISPGGLQIQDQSWPQNMRPWQIKAVHSRARALLVHWSVKGDLGVIVGAGQENPEHNSSQGSG